MLKKITIYLNFLLFLAMIPLANYTLTHIGTMCPNGEPCIIPVWFNPLIYAPSGVLFAGLAFVFRDTLQRLSGLKTSIIAVTIGTILSYLYADKTIAVAAFSAYFLSESCDTYIYSKLQQYSLIIAILLSAGIGLTVDSIVFLHFAFHSLQFLPGQIIGKLWMVLLSIPLIMLSRRILTPSKHQYNQN